MIWWIIGAMVTGFAIGVVVGFAAGLAWADYKAFFATSDPLP